MIKATATPPIEVHHRCPTGQKAPDFVLQAAGIVLADKELNIRNTQIVSTYYKKPV